MAPPITIAIAACNEQAKIEAALRSARACPWCAELMVFDSGSTDRTVEIARQYADRVEFHPWIDYATSKRHMVEQASCQWVFILDADEQITAELAAEIANLPDDQFRRHSVMTMPRRNYLLGRHVRAWNPDRQNRLIDRTRVHWPDRAVHDERLPASGTVKHLRHPLLHNATVSDWADFFDGRRYDQRVAALAGELFGRGRRVSGLGLLLRPAATFCKYFILKGGFLQGGFGANIAWKAAFFNHLKYARLWYLQHDQHAAPPSCAAAEPPSQSTAPSPGEIAPSAANTDARTKP